MSRAPLTDLAIQKLKPPSSGQIEVFDAKATGLSIRVGTRGEKTFHLTYRVKGDRKRRRGTLGRYEFLSLSAARAARWEKLGLAARGIDPFARSVQDGDPAKWKFENCAERFISEHVQRKNKRPNESERIIRKHFVEDWRGRDVREIEWSDIKTILEEIGEKCGHRSSNIAFSRIRKFFRWMYGNSDRADNLPVSPLQWRKPLYPRTADASGS